MVLFRRRMVEHGECLSFHDNKSELIFCGYFFVSSSTWALRDLGVGCRYEA